MAPEWPQAARIDEEVYALVPSLDFGPLRVAEGPAFYRPRHPERTAFYELIDRHFEEFLRVHEDRFEPEDGPLRPVVKDAVAAFLDYDVPRGGFARVRCPECHAEVLLCFSCRTRFFCPSCQPKRAELLAEKLRESILAPVAHRHVVFTIPKVLRPTFFREERLSEGFHERLLTFAHTGGFSVHGRHRIRNEEPARLAHLARYVIRPPVALDRIARAPDG